MIVDTDFLIWYLRGRRAAADFPDRFDPVRLSAMTYMELVQGIRNADELRALRRTLASGRWQMLPITEAISTRAMIHVEEHFLSGSLQMADALIAGTCVEHGERLATRNIKHYRLIAELSIQPFWIGDFSPQDLSNRKSEAHQFSQGLQSLKGVDPCPVFF